MLKSNILTILIFTSINLFAQYNGKPQYQIEKHRAGAYLGAFNIELFPLIAPLHTRNFDSLVSMQFFDSTAFHRVVPGFVIQGGDPNSISGPVSTWGLGQPWQPTVNAEFSVVRHERGRLGAARDVDTNSANSQFYICVAPSLFLDGQYTVYGQVTNGMAVVDTIVSEPRDANDVPLQKIEMFITYTGIDSTIPAAPILTAPVNNATGILNTQSFQWSTVPNAVMYTIEFSTDSLFSSIVLFGNSGTNSKTFTQLQGSQTYWWRVKANTGGKESQYSTPFTFNGATAAANLIYPSDSAVGLPTGFSFLWSAAPLATDYTLQISKGTVFSPGNIIYNTDSIADTTQLVFGLNTNFRYYWRVRSATNGIQGYYSVKYTFLTGTTIGVQQLSNNGVTLQKIYPNPVQNKLNIKIETRESAKATILVTDLSGKIISETPISLLTGENDITIDIKNVSSGTYHLIITENDFEVRDQFLVR